MFDAPSTVKREFRSRLVGMSYMARLTIIRPTILALISDPFRGPLSFAGRQMNPRSVSRSLSPSVCELYPDRSSLSVRKIHDTFQRLNLRVCPEALYGFASVSVQLYYDQNTTYRILRGDPTHR